MICSNCGAQFDGTNCPVCGAPAGAAPTAAPAAAPIQQRSIPLCIVLSIVTFGIYMLYWVYKVNEDTKIVANDPNATSGGMVILLTIITFGIYGIYWGYKQGERIDRVKQQRGQIPGNLAVLYLVLMLVLSVAAIALMQNELNQMAA